MLRYRPSPSMIVACIALIVAVGGTANALPGKNRVKKDDITRSAVSARHIATNAVRASEIRTRAVGASEIRSGAVGTSEARNDSLTGNDVNEPTLGLVPNADRLDGNDSAAFLRSGIVQRFNEVALNDGTGATANQGCASGETLIGGGVRAGTAANAPDVSVNASRPNASVNNSGFTEWQAAASNAPTGATADTTLTVYAICAR
jgi:hypothetical protein